MTQHHHGIVSRFAAGGRSPAPQPGAPGLPGATLVGRGLSVDGARQLLAGEPLTAPSDRRVLGALVGEALGLTAATPDHTIALLLPAVQRIRESAARLQHGPSAPLGPALTADQVAALQRQGVSGAGAQQLAAGLPLADPRDRAALVALLRAAFG